MTLLLSWVSAFLLEVEFRAEGKGRPGSWRRAGLESHRSGYSCGPLPTLLICSPGSIWAGHSRPESPHHPTAGSEVKLGGGGECVWEEQGELGTVLGLRAALTSSREGFPGGLPRQHQGL